MNKDPNNIDQKFGPPTPTSNDAAMLLVAASSSGLVEGRTRTVKLQISFRGFFSSLHDSSHPSVCEISTSGGADGITFFLPSCVLLHIAVG